MSALPSVMFVLSILLVPVFSATMVACSVVAIPVYDSHIQSYFVGGGRTLKSVLNLYYILNSKYNFNPLQSDSFFRNRMKMKPNKCIFIGIQRNNAEF